ncbi:MAG: hypothetical protein ABH871_05300 [Pseudomonadota bacterium]
MVNKVNIEISEVTILEGKSKTIDVKVNDKVVHVPMDKAVYAYFKEQFLRKNPTAQQRKKFATIMNVLRSAYIKGLSDGKKLHH